MRQIPAGWSWAPDLSTRLVGDAGYDHGVYMHEPRSFRDPAQIKLRESVGASSPTVQPLRAYTRDLAQRKSGRGPDGVLMKAFVPQFDPAEAGICARVLFLLEAPGPKANPANGGSGFISVDNNDQTAENFWRFREAAGISEVEAVHWNTVGWYLGASRVKPTAAMRAEGAVELRDNLFPLFHRLEGIVAVGKHAQDAMQRYRKLTPVSRTMWEENIPHSSPLAFNRPHNRANFAAGLDRVRERLGPVTECPTHRRECSPKEPGGY